VEYKDYYKILGVDRGASGDDIKRAYRKLARKYHPDVSKESEAEARFKEVAEAYHVLKDPESRKRYDQLGSGWQAGQEFRPPPGWEYRTYTTRGPGFEEADLGEFSEFFRRIFGGATPFADHRGPGGRHAPQRGADVEARLSIDLEDAYHGHTIGFSMQSMVWDEKGEMRPRTRNLKVKIPKGIREGQQIRLAGKGGEGPGTVPPGDLYLTVVFKPHRLFEPRGRDIYLVLPVSPWESALGATVKVPTLGGPVELKIPAGSQTGTQLRLRGRGLPGDPAGDQYVVLRVVVPPARTDADKALYRKMSEQMHDDPRAGMEV
jgi:curved DNA-binding protein